MLSPAHKNKKWKLPTNLLEMYRVSKLFGVCIASLLLVNCDATAIFDVMNYGAVGDGVRDDTQAFQRAWVAACNGNEENPTLSIPMAKTFLLRPITFKGPCKSEKINVQVLGRIIAPNDINAWTGCTENSWIYFSSVSGLTVEGSGEIHGRGSLWWAGNTPANKNNGCCNRPTALNFYNCKALQLKGLNHVDSPRNHIGICQCNGSTISNLQIFAPQNSPNTDGIDVADSTQVQILNSTIQTGDDCIAINTGCSNIYVSNISCGPGHGISVGSLGANKSYAAVESVNISHCFFNGTQNGARIKTWPGGSGYARFINFEHITVINVQNPIIIDQYYCNGVEFQCKDQSSAVRVSDVTFKDVRGSTTSKQAINLNCSNNEPCTKIRMEKINITQSKPGTQSHASCNNAVGQALSTSPAVPCLLSL